MEHIKALLLFHQVLQQGSMSAVAKQQGISPSAISQQLTQLEQHYGVKLLNRSTRSLSPTPAGNALLQQTAQLQQLLEQTERQLQALTTELNGEVSISLPSGFIDSPPIQQLINQVKQHYPHIQLNLLPEDQLIDLNQHPIDIAIRASAPLANSNLIARHLACWQLMLCASPHYLQQHPLNSPQQLAQHYWIVSRDSVWQNLYQHTALNDIPRHHIIHCPLLLAARTLALAGQGITFQLSGEIAPYLQRGELVAVLPNIPLPRYNLYAITRQRQLPAKVSAVLGLLKNCFKAET